MPSEKGPLGSTLNGRVLTRPTRPAGSETGSGNRHAYLIVAHHQFDLLSTLLKLLDDERNDIYVHVDSKARNFSPKLLQEHVKRSGLHFIERTSVNWGGASFIRVELNLLRAASESRYEYYHLLSGADLPLRSQAEIHDFFDRHQGLEFIEFASAVGEDIENRVDVYHLIQEYLKREWSQPVSFGVRALNRLILSGQRQLGVNRLKSLSLPLMFGSAWYSITGDLARYVTEQSGWIETNFSWSHCADELFLQTLVNASPFKQNVASRAQANSCGNLRAIDWVRSESEDSPYIWRSSDFDTLVNSGSLFARKFDKRVDRQIIERLEDHVLAG